MNNRVMALQSDPMFYDLCVCIYGMSVNPSSYCLYLNGISCEPLGSQVVIRCRQTDGAVAYFTQECCSNVVQPRAQINHCLADMQSLSSDTGSCLPNQPTLLKMPSYQIGQYLNLSQNEQLFCQMRSRPNRLTHIYIGHLIFQLLNLNFKSLPEFTESK